MALQTMSTDELKKAVNEMSNRDLITNLALTARFSVLEDNLDNFNKWFAVESEIEREILSRMEASNGLG